MLTFFRIFRSAPSVDLDVREMVEGFAEFIFGDFPGPCGYGGFGGGLELADGG